MSTNWTTPNVISQYAEDPSHIEWNDDYYTITTLNGGLALSKPLLHISRQPKNDIKTKTWFLSATNFNFQNLPTVISGISLRISANRQGRVTDDTVQLVHNGELIGENRCSRVVSPVNIYGGDSDTWGVENLTDIVHDSTFGIVVRFKSHPDWPHSTTPILRGLELQIY